MRLQTFLAPVLACFFVPILLQAQSNNVNSTDPNAGKTTLAGNTNVSVDTGAAGNQTGKNPAAGKDTFAGMDPFAPAGPSDKVPYKYDQNELAMEKMDGTVMVQHPGDPKPFALATLKTVEKGDIIMVYDKSWVVFQDHRGDRIGLAGNTTISVDEFFIGGPDRQVRLLLQRGSLLLRTNNSGSKQSFFEINAGSVVTAVGDSQAILTYKPEDKEHLLVQYFRGKMSVIDKNNEYKFGVMPKMGSNIKNIKDKENTTDVTQTQLDYIPEWSELNWENGILQDKIPATVEEIVNINYKRFYDGEPQLTPSENNILLDESQKVSARDR